MRSYGEVIDVRTSVRLPGEHGGAGHDAVPQQFLWRGRIYLVREVLAHWIELGTWWSVRGSLTPAAVRGPVHGAEHAAVRALAQPQTPSSPPARSVAADVGAVERAVWRVEAAAGRSAHPGVFDLVHDLPAHDLPAHDPADLPPRWRLARALD